MTSQEPRYRYEHLVDFATTLFVKAGLSGDRARIVGQTLVDGDVMGHSTHGLRLLAPYIKELETGEMKKTGEPEVVNDQGATITWEGNYLPGPWLVNKAIDVCLERIEYHPMVTVAIRRSHHIGCLATYPERATRKDLMMLLYNSDPHSKSVAPFGGIQPVYSPSPIAGGIPTEGDPIVFDISTSTTAHGFVLRSHEEGKKLPGKWMLDSKGIATDDPSGLVANPPSTILPLGGMDAGHKGFALGLLVEALTAGLSGHGRLEGTTTWGGSVLIQIINPDAFAGKEAFKKQMQHVVDLCKAVDARPDSEGVRMPGERAFALRRDFLHHGVVLHPTIMPGLKEVCAKYGVEFPVNS